MQFFYNKKKYGITQFEGYEFYEWNVEQSYQSYPTIEEFAQKATVDGILLKDAFTNIKKLSFA